jgi:hypothetical protein
MMSATSELTPICVRYSLFERADTTRDYRPSYIGTSARLLAASSMPVAQAADDDDTAKRTVMTVNAFGKATLNDGHPRIFVAKGTHALYLAPGSYAVAYPNESHPNFCGGFEGIPPPTAPPETHLADTIAETRLQSLLVLLGYVGGEPVADMRRTDDDLRAGGKHAVHAARQSQNAHDVTRDERGVEDGVKRLAAALERETRGFRNLRALRNNRGACGRVELVIANDLAERHCHVEISRAPDLENDWGLAIAEVL